jgi:hypothetical protein
VRLAASALGWFDYGAASGCGACPASVWKNPSKIESRHLNKNRHFWW